MNSEIDLFENVILIIGHFEFFRQISADNCNEQKCRNFGYFTSKIN